MAYVPPWKRAGAAPSAGSVPPPETQRGGRPRPPRPSPNSFSYVHLLHHFTHPPDSTLTMFRYAFTASNPPPRRPPYDPTNTPWNTPLPPSPPPPPPRHPLHHLISYIRIFPKAHPAWDTHRELWVHTRADELIADYGGAKSNFGRPIPLFSTHNSAKEWFGSEGYWIIEDLLVVEPRSDELKRMLAFKNDKQGYSRQGRTAAAWAESLNATWVRLRLVPAPPTGEHYDSLKPIMDVPGGSEGEVEKYMLEIGGLAEELEVLDGVKEERRAMCEKAGVPSRSLEARA